MLQQEILDMSNGCGENYAVIIVSEQFEGKVTIVRHRLGKSPAFLVCQERGFWDTLVSESAGG
jgi:acid stress-induced BolA-like protein IbaG/YrbA